MQYPGWPVPPNSGPRRREDADIEEGIVDKKNEVNA